MIKTVDVSEAQSHLQELLNLAAQGHEIIITQDQHPAARLLGFNGGQNAKRIGGLDNGQVKIAADFDAPLPDELQRLFE